MDESKCYLYLSENPVKFEPVNSVSSVFFDESNGQVFTTRSNGAGGVNVKGPDAKTFFQFRLEDRGEIVSMKFSPDCKILALQRSPTSVDFINFAPGADRVEYSQTCKARVTRIIGFCWTSPTDIVFITDHSVECYQVIPERKLLKQLKAYNLFVNWFVWLAESSVLIVSTGTSGATIQPISFKSSVVTRWPKFDLELPVGAVATQLCIRQTDVTLANLYGQVCLLLLRHQAYGSNPTTDIFIYTLNKESPSKKTDVLALGLSGRFAINVVDNLVVVHHQTSKNSFLFDLRMSGSIDELPTKHHPVLPAMSISSFKLLVSAVPASTNITNHELNCDLYSATWAIFSPDIIIDAGLGFFWHLKLRLEPITDMIHDRNKLVKFLLLRQNSKSVILDVCKSFLLSRQPTPYLPVIAAIFEQLNQVYFKHLEAEIQALANDNGRQDLTTRQMVVDQSDMYTVVFTPLTNSKELSYKFVVAVLLEYIKSLSRLQIPIQHFLYELVINSLVNNACYFQLHQFLQYHVIGDSKPLACLLLSIEAAYPPAYQLAMDMLKRLNTANGQIIEVLLSKGQLLPALRFIQNVGMVDQVSARKFLEAARSTDDDMLFYTVFRFFEQRNVKLRGSPAFLPGEHCDIYVTHYETVFGNNSDDTSQPSRTADK